MKNLHLLEPLCHDKAELASFIFAPHRPTPNHPKKNISILPSPPIRWSETGWKQNCPTAPAVYPILCMHPHDADLQTIPPRRQTRLEEACADLLEHCRPQFHLMWARRSSSASLFPPLLNHSASVAVIVAAPKLPQPIILRTWRQNENTDTRIQWSSFACDI